MDLALAVFDPAARRQAHDAVMELASSAPLLVASLWSGGLRPYLAPDEWTAVWQRCGYADYLPDERRSADRPTAPLELYRGASTPWRYGLSWTTDRDHAQRYADAKPDGLLWCARVHPYHLLAYVAAEDEHVVHPAGLSEANVWRAGERPPPLVASECAQ